MPTRARPDWPALQRELATFRQVVELTGATDNTVRAWRRRRDFPAPVLTFKGKGGRWELWSRTEIKAWLEREASWNAGHRLRRQ
jgi:predicted DNA-binding transcriptional regulator AlpA